MKTITSIRSFPRDTPRDALEKEVTLRLDQGALSCSTEEEDDVILLITVRPGPDMIKAAIKAAPRDPQPLNAAARVAAVEAKAEAVAVAPLGSLSAKYESNGDAGAIGEDGVGGPSYGAYQIATRTGTMESFLAFVRRAAPEFADRLDGAGGAGAAKAKSPAFVTTWKSLAADPGFLDVQHGFIKVTHYDPFVEKIGTDLRILVDRRSRALQNVAWSTAVQHGPANRIFSNALQPNEVANNRRDREIIEAIYAERSNVDKYFRNSVTAVKESVRKRFARELADALALLG